MLGQMSFREMRADAERRSGSEFDIKEFHDAMLCCRALPLNVLKDSIRVKRVKA